MKILYVVHGGDMMGANRSLLELVLEVRHYGAEPVLLLPDKGELAEVLDREEVSYLVAPFYPWANTKYLSKGYWLNGWRQRKNRDYLSAIIELVQPQKFDIIYSNTSIVGIGAQLAEALGLPHIWHIREFGEKDYNIAFYGGRALFTKWANKAAAIISISHTLKKEVLAHLTAPVKVLYDGVITTKRLESITPNQNHHKNPFVFLIIGLIHPTKGQLTALKAFHQVYREHPNTKLLLAGRGRRLYTKRLLHYIKKNKLEGAVEYLGYTKEPYKVHQKASCVLVCSRNEGMGRVTIEGMIFGNPVIGYKGGATPELIQHGQNGLLYSNGVEDLATCMKQLVVNRDLAAQYGKNGREQAAKYVIEVAAKEEYKIYQEALASFKAPA